jgi:hypothetical protein
MPERVYLESVLSGLLCFCPTCFRCQRQLSLGCCTQRALAAPGDGCDSLRPVRSGEGFDSRNDAVPLLCQFVNDLASVHKM